MKRKRHTPEGIIKKLREAATLLAEGQSVEAVCKRLAVSPPTYHRWRQEYAAHGFDPFIPFLDGTAKPSAAR